MKPIVTAKINDLAKMQWFSAVGGPLTEPYLPVCSWSEAIAHCCSVEWENVQLGAKGEMTAYLAVHHPHRDQLWNDLILEIRPCVQKLVSASVARFKSEQSLPERFENSVRWDVLHWMMELEYADVYPRSFYSKLGVIYCHGHFPCGWEGMYPAGRLVVF